MLIRNLPTHLRVSLASHNDEVQAAQRLRHQVFVKELGAHSKLSEIDAPDALEMDDFDPHAQHLCLFDPLLEEHDPKNSVIATCRLIDNRTAQKCGGFYSEQEFNISAILKSHTQRLEIGRSCVHPNYRGGFAATQLWSALFNYIKDQQITCVFGTASYFGTDLKSNLQSLSYLHHHHLSEPNHRAYSLDNPFPQSAWLPAHEIDQKIAMHQTPPLIKAYLRAQGTIGEGVYIDHDFNSLDIFVLMNPPN